MWDYKQINFCVSCACRNTVSHGNETTGEYRRATSCIANTGGKLKGVHNFSQPIIWNFELIAGPLRIVLRKNKLQYLNTLFSARKDCVLWKHVSPTTALAPHKRGVYFEAVVSYHFEPKNRRMEFTAWPVGTVIVVTLFDQP